MEEKQQEFILIYGGFNEGSPRLSDSILLFNPVKNTIQEIFTPNLGLRAYIGQAAVTSGDQRSLFLFGGTSPTYDSYTDDSLVIQFWEKHAALPKSLTPIIPPDAIQTLALPNGDVYVGQMMDGMRHGQGKCTYPNGDVYEGEWQHDMRNGQGNLLYDENGEQYCGEWQNDLRHGHGVLLQTTPLQNSNQTTPNQREEIKFEGCWVNDKRNGVGSATYSDHSILTGEWIEDKWAEGSKAHLENYKEEMGEQYKSYPVVACSYAGDVLDGIPHGQGKSQSSLETYVGGWSKGKRHGKGTSTLIDGTVYSGEWRNGKHNGFGVCEYAKTRDRYEGKWVGGVRCGRGICTYASGSVYEGEWKEDKCHGYGRYTYADGAFYEGNWKENKFCGDGALVLDKLEDQVICLDLNASCSSSRQNSFMT
jgi:hypothetical protein